MSITPRHGGPPLFAFIEKRAGRRSALPASFSLPGLTSRYNAGESRVPAGRVGKSSVCPALRRSPDWPQAVSRSRDDRHGGSDLVNGLWAQAETIQDLYAATAREGTAGPANLCPAIRLPVSAHISTLSMFINRGLRRRP